MQCSFSNYAGVSFPARLARKMSWTIAFSLRILTIFLSSFVYEKATQEYERIEKPEEIALLLLHWSVL